LTAIEFQFDFISPYAYLAWTQIHALADRHGVGVKPTPVLFAAFLNAHGHKGPAEIPPKRVYIFKDVMRTAAALGVPLQPPPTHPFNPLLGLRVASLDMEEEVRRELVDRLYAETWGGGVGLTDPVDVERIAALCGVPNAVERAHTAESKQRVRSQTERALKGGTFGVPTMVIRGEIFWGYDSFAHLDRFLVGDDPLGPDDLEKWAHIVPSATR